MVTVNRVQSVYETPVYATTSGGGGLGEGEAAVTGGGGVEGEGAVAAHSSSTSRRLAYTRDTSPEGMDRLGREGYGFDLRAYAGMSHAFQAVHIGHVFLRRPPPPSSPSSSGRRALDGLMIEQGATRPPPLPFVTLLIPAYNAAGFITDALRSAVVGQRGDLYRHVWFLCICICIICIYTYVYSGAM